MQSQYRHDAHGESLPEVHHQEHSYLYSVPDQSPAHSTEKSYGAAPLPTGTRKGWARWWVLALIILLVAIIAGLVGGFIGQAIQKSRESSNQSPAASLPSPSACPTSNSTSSSVTPPSASTSNIIGAIVRPDTGCGWPASRQRKRMLGTSTYQRLNYTTLCNSGWVGYDGILGFWTLTPSDCIEACQKYNDRPTKESNRRCVGGGFIPDWTNQTVGAREQKGPPFNCYLQSATSGLGSNDQETFGLEVVALCLEGQCDSISLS